jgi:hypothetical protein
MPALQSALEETHREAAPVSAMQSAATVMAMKGPRLVHHGAKARLLFLLAECARNPDKERAHGNADDALLEYINDPDITKAYNAFEKWYA